MKFFKYFSVFVLLLFGIGMENVCLAKVSNEKDSLIQLIRSQTTDTGRINETARIYDNILWKNPDKETFQLLIDALFLAKKIGYKKGILKMYNHMAGFSMNVRNKDFALKYIHENLKLALELQDSIEIARCYHALARTFENKDSSLFYFQKALRITEMPKFYSKRRASSTYTQLGMTYYSLGNDSLAFHYLFKGYDLRKEVGTRDEMLNSLMFLGMVYEGRKKYTPAIATHAESIELLRDVKDSNSIASLYSKIANDYFLLEDLRGARIYLDSALALMPFLRSDPTRMEICGVSYKFYERQGDISRAYDYLKQYRELKDIIFSAEKINMRNEMIVKYESQQEEEEIESLQQQNELKDQVLSRNRVILYSSVFAAILLILLALVLLRGNKSRKRANQLLQGRNEQIQKQKSIIEIKNKDITDSINYAQRIQQAMLPEREEIKKHLSDSFVLFKPKDVVSGDFYWFTEKDGKIIIAAADCTGHGVPGALMSMIGSTLLNEIVNNKGITKPSDILFHLREGVIRSLKQTGAQGENKDGMDIALCSLDKSKYKLEFAGANNPLWILKSRKFGDRSESIFELPPPDSELQEIKGDKQPIGIYMGEANLFLNHEMRIEKGDTLYIFTDGFADQFGGPKGKKFKYRQFQELLLELQNKSMQEQEYALLATFSSWKGTLEQVDDILVMGIKI